MRLNSFGLSDLGNKRRNNEDRFLRDDRRGVYIVCDGMGGAAAGEVASGNSAALVYSELIRQQEVLDAFHAGVEDSVLQLTVTLETAVRAANREIWDKGRADPDRKGMGSTLSALCLGKDTAVVAHVGDSRVYQLHAGEVAVLTDDHTWVADQVRKGRMTPEEAKTSKKQNLILRALGTSKDVQVDTRVVPVFEGDRFLLCSDGLHGYFTSDDEARTLLGKGNNLQRLGWECIALARERGGKDNITAVLVEALAG
ncbi:MAG: protein phosphatase 2C domain-containing protein [Myxococcota bacterium]